MFTSNTNGKNTVLLLWMIVVFLFNCSIVDGEDKGMARPEKIMIYDPGSARAVEVEKVRRSDEEWRKLLTPEQYRVTRLKGTERPFSCARKPPAAEGCYNCVCCGTALFRIEHKFESGTGWPSFFQPIDQRNITLYPYRSHGMVRTEISCARCDAHLGHVFDDGPPPAFKRYCINSIALRYSDTCR